jgi:hypothetical protein
MENVLTRLHQKTDKESHLLFHEHLLIVSSNTYLPSVTNHHLPLDHLLKVL